MTLQLPIAKDGIYKIPLDVYHSQCCQGPSASSSNLRTLFKQSPAHCFEEWSGNPNRDEDDDDEQAADTRAFILGRAAHHLLLGEDAFSTLFIMRPAELNGKPWHGNRTVCQDWLKAQQRAGRTVLLPSELRTIRGMARSLAANPLVEAGILNGDVENSLICRHKPTGIWTKSRPDVIPTDSGDFADLKTTVSVDYDELARAIAKYGYHQQGALVGHCWKQITGRPMTSFSLVFVEKKPPHCVRIVTLKENDLERGHLQNEIALELMAECLETGEWPGPAFEREDAEFIELPKWEQDRIDFKLELLKDRLARAKAQRARQREMTIGV